jgi:peptidoglycan/LPS O-acetylase OafA/YrhL
VRDVTTCIVLGTLASTGVGLIAYHVLEKPLTAWLFDRLDDHAEARRRRRIDSVAVGGRA